jgi:hypothetical protein
MPQPPIPDAASSRDAAASVVDAARGAAGAADAQPGRSGSAAEAGGPLADQFSVALAELGSPDRPAELPLPELVDRLAALHTTLQDALADLDRA